MPETVLEGVAGDPGGGPYVILRLETEGERVAAGDWETNGCPAAQTAACGLIGFAKGRTIDQLRLLDSDDLLTIIGGLPEGKGYYANLVIEALRRALGMPAGGGL